MREIQGHRKFSLQSLELADRQLRADKAANPSTIPYAIVPHSKTADHFMIIYMPTSKVQTYCYLYRCLSLPTAAYRCPPLPTVAHR